MAVFLDSFVHCDEIEKGAEQLASSSVVVAQLVEWSLPIPEVHGSNPVIGKNLFIY